MFSETFEATGQGPPSTGTQPSPEGPEGAMYTERLRSVTHVDTAVAVGRQDIFHMAAGRTGSLSRFHPDSSKLRSHMPMNNVPSNTKPTSLASL